MKPKMNNLTTLSVFCATLIATASFAANPNVNTSFNISATLQQTISLSKIRDLSFPAQTSGTAATYTVAPTDATSAAFSATGTPLQTAQLSFGAPTATLTCTSGACLSSGVNTITVNAFQCGATTCEYTFNTTGGITNMSIGASESIVAANQSGTYTGTQNITLAYK